MSAQTTSEHPAKSPSTPEIPTFIPGAPFDDTDADLLLTSCDGADFRVQSHVLALLSPVFKGMFSFPQPPGETEIPRVQMSETAIVLDRVLRFCYPGGDCDPVDLSLQQLKEILDIGRHKYDIQSIVPRAKMVLKSKLNTDPVAAFAIACSQEWNDLAVNAARSSLRFPIRSFDFVPELRNIPAHQYQAILRYHAECSAVCVDSTKTLETWYKDTSKSFFTCQVCPPSALWTRPAPVKSRQYSRTWFSCYLKAARHALKVQPLADLSDPVLMVDAVKGFAECASCRAHGFDHLQEFAKRALPARINSVINTVCIFRICVSYALIVESIRKKSGSIFDRVWAMKSRG
ncbi:BTB domain-containing protein [Favolaschia claudopus]|uniref:BTB domain-containing protein n=1 Tax=Favolaschia claudopus TaxID=2862362 RepID=A0AAW0B0S2_9AGAR